MIIFQHAVVSTHKELAVKLEDSGYLLQLEVNAGASRESAMVERVKAEDADAKLRQKEAEKKAEASKSEEANALKCL